VRTRLFHTEGFRISAIFVAVFAVLAAAMAVSVLVTVQQGLEDQIVAFAKADIAAAGAGYRAEGVPEAQEVIAQRMTAPGASDYFLLQQNGKRLAGNLPVMPETTGVVGLPAPGAAHHTILGTAAYLAPGVYMFAGSDLDPVRQTRQHILIILFWLFILALLLAMTGGILVSRFFLRRTDAIAKACRAIMEGDLAARVPMRGTGDELDRLSQNINLMLDRIAGLMENIRQVTNDIAHDLRTPVAHLRHRLEDARLHARAPADYDQALDAAITATDEILALFAALLRIAEIEGGARRAAFAMVDLREVLGQLQDIFGPVADDAGHALNVTPGGPAMVRGDRELIVQLLSNLIENAIVHTPAGTHIALATAAEKDGVLVTVADDGPGVPAEEHAKLFQPLYRRENSRARPGHGLGLALVSAIADLHDAKLHTPGRPGGGFCISITFPVAA
jgi:signal transduction histidine kinase